MPEKKDNNAANQKPARVITYNVPATGRIDESTTIKHRELINVRDSVRPPKGTRR